MSVSSTIHLRIQSGLKTKVAAAAVRLQMTELDAVRLMVGVALVYLERIDYDIPTAIVDQVSRSKKKKARTTSAKKAKTSKSKR